MKQALHRGDWVVYRKSKQGPAPGPRAQAVMACSKGENYAYIVDKFWVVDQVLPGGRVRLRTRRGKVHELPVDDPNLRKAGLWDRFFHGERFREISLDSDVGPAMTA